MCELPTDKIFHNFPYLLLASTTEALLLNLNILRSISICKFTGGQRESISAFYASTSATSDKSKTFTAWMLPSIKKKVVHFLS